jgi:hypothetical protein
MFNYVCCKGTADCGLSGEVVSVCILLLTPPTHSYQPLCLQAKASVPPFLPELTCAATCAAALSLFNKGTQGFFYVVCCRVGAGFLLWELSTPFVHFRWFLHRSGAGKSRLYVVNGLVMMLVFFLCRPLWGTWLSYRVRARQSGSCMAPRGGRT